MGKVVADMDDKEILDLYWQRDMAAIQETDRKYGAYCKSIALHILENHEDAEECTNDTYLKAWNSIPPQRPQVLSAYLGKLVRNLSFDRYRYRQARKRGAGQMELVLEELAECVSGCENVEQEMDRRELVRTLNDFLQSISQELRGIFLCRYWYAMPVGEIARRFGKTESNVSVILNRLRKKLRVYLEERGYEV